jgi:competence protein ComEC
MKIFTMQLLQILETEYWRLTLWNIAFFIFGIIYYFALNAEPSWYSILIGVGISSFTFLVRRYGSWGILLSGITLAFVLGVVIGKIRTSQVNTVALKEEVITSVQGKIVEIKYTVKAVQLILDDIQFGQLLLQDKDPSKIRITVPIDNIQPILIGDYVYLNALLSPPTHSIIPGGYDFGLYSYFRGIGATGFALSKITRINPNIHKHAIDSHIHSIRTYIYLRLIDIMGKDNGNFAAALLLGESGGLNRTIMQNMRYSGLAHVLCVSGLHLSLVAGIFFLASRVLLNLSNKIAWTFNIKIISAIISLIGSGAYLMLSGAQIAATRAYIMTSIFMIAIILNRVPYPIRSLGMAAILILTINPEYVLHPSFQLSFAAVLALIGGYELYIKHKWILGNSYGIIANIKLFIFSNIYSSLLASLATTPIVIYHFYTVANYTILANLLVVPVISFIIMPLSIIAMVLLPFGLDYYLLLVISKFISLIVVIADWVANLPSAIWYVGYISPISLIIYMLGLFWVVIWNSKLRLYGLIIIAIAITIMSISPKPDIMFDAQSGILGLKNTDNKLEIYAQKMSSFTKNYWKNWFGQKEDMFYKQNITLTDHSITTKTGKIVKILFHNTDCNADLVINMISDEILCPNQLSKSLLESVGAILIFCNEAKCTYKYNDINRFIFR